MRGLGLAGIRRGKTTITTVSNPKAPCPLDKVNREFQVSRPNALWVVDFTYVHTWIGFVYVAFVIDAFARRIVGWKVSTSATAGFVLDALEQAIHARRPVPEDGLIHHSDRGVQCGFNQGVWELVSTELKQPLVTDEPNDCGQCHGLNLYRRACDVARAMLLKHAIQPTKIKMLALRDYFGTLGFVSLHSIPLSHQFSHVD